MNYLLTVSAFLFVIFVLVIFHEFGHFLVARLCGVKVLRFSFGIGKVLWSHQFSPNGTQWAISLFPIGGYVKMLDKRTLGDQTLTTEEQQQEFTSQPVYKRMAIVAAGPFANFLLALFILSCLYMVGVPHLAPVIGEVPENSAAYAAGLRGREQVRNVSGEPIAHFAQIQSQIIQAIEQKKQTVSLSVSDPKDERLTHNVDISLKDVGNNTDQDSLYMLGLSPPLPKIILSEVFEKGPADIAGIKSGDQVISVDGQEIMYPDELLDKLDEKAGQRIVLGINRLGEIIHIPVDLGATYKQGKRVGQMKVKITINAQTVTIQYSMPDSVVKAAEKTWDVSVLSVQMIAKLFTGEESPKNLAGPITIAKYAGKTASAGIITYLYFIVFISISMGIMNLLPIPVLDGGLLLYYAVEVVLRGRVSEKWTQMGYRVGLVLLAMLMLLALFNDVIGLFP